MQSSEELAQNPIPEDGERPERATTAEMEARVEYTAMMLVEGRSKSAIKRFFKENYSLSARQVERYLRLARDRLVAETEKGRRELIAESFGFYMRILHEAGVTVSERLSARAKADELMGLPAPKRVIEAQIQVDDALDLWVDNLTTEQKEAINEAAIQAELLEEETSRVKQLQYEERMRGAIEGEVLDDESEATDGLIEGESEEEGELNDD